MVSGGGESSPGSVFCHPERRAGLSMKAVVITGYGGPEVLQVCDVPAPQPSVGEELVRVEAGGLNFADTMTMRGGYPGTPKPPLVAGREWSPEAVCYGLYPADGALKKGRRFR
jgi:D-arabinose 1-dehydrogenase-like Zn-dependent alcohol dehydrogenase